MSSRHTPLQAQLGIRGIVLLMLNLGVRWGVSGERHAPAAFSLRQGYGSVVQEARWASRLFWRKCSCPTGIELRTF